MGGVLAILGAAGGVAVFIGGVWAIVRGIIRQTDATKDNTDALEKLTATVDSVIKQQNENTRDIAVLKAKRRR